MQNRKVKRDTYNWSGQKKIIMKRRLIWSVVLIGVAAIGWFSFDPTFNFVSKFIPGATQSEEQNTSSIISSSSDVIISSTSAPKVEESANTKFTGKSVFIEHNVMLDENLLISTLNTLKQHGAKQVVFDIKNVDGRVMYNSTLDVVINNLTLNETTYDLKKCVDIIKSNGLIPVGRIFAFKDRTAPASMYDAAVKYMNSEINWIDNSKDLGGKTWLNPNSARARDYVIQIIDDVSNYLDIILLDGVQFPTGISLEKATYGAQGEVINKTDVIKDFLNIVIDGKKEKNVTIIPIISGYGLFDTRGSMYGTEIDKLLNNIESVVFDIRPHIFGRGLISEKIALPQPSVQPYQTLSLVLEKTKDFKCQNKIYTLQEHNSIIDGEEIIFDEVKINEQKQAFEENNCENILYFNVI